MVYEKFAGYKPRESGTASWTGGPKVANFDRVVWQIIPDSATASAALQSGEIDWWETPIPDVVPLLRKNRNLAVDIADPLGNIGDLRMNHLYPPFNDPRVRQAALIAVLGPWSVLDDGVWHTIKAFVSFGMSNSCFRLRL